MYRRHINTAFDDHDYDQLLMLAKMNKIKMPELVRRICRAYLDKGTAKIREDDREKQP
jgi:hypothetical protein